MPVLTLRFEKCTSTKDTAECRHMVLGFFFAQKAELNFRLPDIGYFFMLHFSFLFLCFFPSSFFHFLSFFLVFSLSLVSFLPFFRFLSLQCRIKVYLLPHSSISLPFSSRSLYLSPLFSFFLFYSSFLCFLLFFCSFLLFPLFFPLFFSLPFSLFLSSFLSFSPVRFKTSSK